MFAIFFSTANSVVLNYSVVFNFGDSNSDTGELVAAVGDILNLPYGQTYFNAPSGRFCNGRLIIDFLSKSSLITNFKLYTIMLYKCTYIFKYYYVMEVTCISG